METSFFTQLVSKVAEATGRNVRDSIAHDMRPEFIREFHGKQVTRDIEIVKGITELAFPDDPDETHFNTYLEHYDKIFEIYAPMESVV